MTMMDESEIRQRFAQLREADRERAPGFAQIYGRARVRSGSGAMLHVRPFVIAAAAAVVIATLWIAKARSFSSQTATPTIASWRAPTDVLLRTPGSELLGTMPALGASVLDKMILTPTNRGT
jgi:glycerol-3-phosphate acyltransferase PlsY